MIVEVMSSLSIQRFHEFYEFPEGQTRLHKVATKSIRFPLKHK